MPSISFSVHLTHLSSFTNSLYIHHASCVLINITVLYEKVKMKRRQCVVLSKYNLIGYLTSGTFPDKLKKTGTCI